MKVIMLHKSFIILIDSFTNILIKKNIGINEKILWWNPLDTIQPIQHKLILHYKAAYLKRVCNFLHYSLVINKRPPPAY